MCLSGPMWSERSQYSSQPAPPNSPAFPQSYPSIPWPCHFPEETGRKMAQVVSWGLLVYFNVYCVILNRDLGERESSNCAWRPPAAPPLDIGFPDETVHCCSWTTIPHHLCPKGLSFTLRSPPLITSAAKHHPAPSSSFSSACP